MKKTVKILFAVLIVCLLALICTACNQTCADGEHTWDEWSVTVQPGCDTVGSQTRKCTKCGEEQTEEIPATGAHIITDDGTLPLCTTIDMTQSYTCKLCGKTITGDALKPALSHSSKIVFEIPATCTEDGVKRGHKCRDCDYLIDGCEKIAALGHHEVDIAATEATCTQPAYTAGSKCDRCNIFFVEPQAVDGSAPLGHDFDQSQLNYFTFTKCSRCNTYKILDSENTYAEEFVYSFSQDDQTAFETLYNEIEAAAQSGDLEQADFEAKCEELDDRMSDIQSQYQIARIINDESYNATTKEQFQLISEFYNSAIEMYYNMFRLAYDSKYSTGFYTDWTENEIKQVLSYSESFDKDAQNEVDRIQAEYEDLLETMGGGISKDTPQAQLNQLYQLYADLVEANNQIATSAGYDNYMEYAYEVVYERDYKPEQTQVMRDFVKEYMGDVAQKIVDDYDALEVAYEQRGDWTYNDSMLYYSRFINPWMWRDPNNYLTDSERQSLVVDDRNDIFDYYKFLSEEQLAPNKINFSVALDDLFKNGNYFLSVNPNMTAYTWYIYSLNLPILNFGQDDYRDPFTFIHEFGHYYQFVYNGTLGVSMDQDETQSQGNEMLFLAWLEQRVTNKQREGFDMIKLDQMLNAVGTIILSTAVDEFENVCYTGATEYNGQPLPTVTLDDDQKIIDYGKLYKTILKSYWSNVTTYFNENYWAYVVFDQAGYYISYAMSALPSLEIYAKAANEGLEAARESYIKLFTFSDNEAFMDVDQYGDPFIKNDVTYQQILNWAGLKGPFEAELYQTIRQAFLGSN